MATKFLSNHRISITPLSPIHIGCGEIFEPTNYVIDTKRGFLYGFDPSDAVLRPDEFESLSRVARSSSIRRINRYYEAHCDVFRPWARSILPVSSKCIGQYHKMIDPHGDEKNTQLYIYRTQSGLVGGSPVPYIPGSSIKGVIVTALLNRLNQDEGLSEENYEKKYQKSLTAPYKALDGDLQRKLLGADFSLYPSRLVRVSDFHSDDAKTRVLFTHRFFNSDHGEDVHKELFEAIIPGQYRAFKGDLTLNFNNYQIEYRKNKFGKIKNSYKTAESLFNDIHSYAYERWMDYQGLYEHFAPEWTQQMLGLFKALEPEFESGRLALIRLGKNTGAESKTLHGKNQPRILITHKPKDGEKIGKKEVLDHSTTSWFTNEGNTALTGLSYGWAICELDPNEDCSVLREWCSRTYSQWIAAHPGGSINDEWDRVLEERQAKLKLREELLVEEQARKRAEEEARIAAAKVEAEKVAELAAMSPEKRLVTDLCDAIEATNGTITNVNSELFIRTKQVLSQAVEWSDAQLKLEFAQRLQPLMKKKDMYQGKAAKVFKQQLKMLKGEA